MANWEYEASKLIFLRNKENYKTVDNDSSAYSNDDKTYIDSIYNRNKGIIKAIEAIDSNFKFELNDKAYSVGEIAEFLEYIQSLIDSDNSALKKMDVIEYFSDKEVSLRPNKNLLSNLKKGDAEYELDMLVCELIKRGDYKTYGNSFQRCFNYNRQQYNIEVNERKQDFSVMIRTHEDIKYVAKCFDVFKENYCYNLSNAMNDRKYNYPFQYDMQEAMYLILEEMDVFEFIFMQILIYKIMSNEAFSMKKKMDVMTSIKDACKEFNDKFVPKTEKASKQNVFYSFAIYLLYLTVRNEYTEYKKIMVTLINQMKDPGYKMKVEEAYKYQPKYIYELDTSEQMYYILEGEKIRNDRFKGNIEDCMHLITLLDTITGRWLGGDYLQHVKVVYREVIMDDLKYNNKTSRTIMRNIENKDYPYFDYIKDSFFVREKISRGLYREKDVAELYELKCEIQYLLQEALLKIFSNYDEVRIAKDFNSVYKGYKKILLSALEL